METLVSVIVPVYNSEKYLKSCIESILNQTYKSIEIILVNDGSIDKSLDIIKEYESRDKRVICIDKKNTGVSSTRNIGIDKATGKYIMFIDSDDFIENDYIEELLNITEKENLDICRTGFIVEKKGNVHEVINYAEEESKEIDPNDFKENFIDTTIFNSSCVQLIKTSIVKENNIRFKENLSYEEDLIFNIELFKHCKKIKYVNLPKYHYLANESSSTRNLCNTNNIINSIIKSNKEIVNLSKHYNVNIETEITTKHFQMIVMYLFQVLKKDIKLFKEVISKIKKEDFRYLTQHLNLKKIKSKEKLKMYIIICIYNLYLMIKKLNVKKFIKNIMTSFRKLKYKFLIKNKNISIICNDCCGGCIYSDIGMKFNSPTINLFFSNNDFITYISNLKEYNELELKEKVENNGTYPIGILESKTLPKIEINFMHYKSFEEANEKWNIRKSRINYDNILFLFHLNEDNSNYIKHFLELNLKNKVLLLYENHKIPKSYNIKNNNIINIVEPKKYMPGVILERHGLLNKRYLEQINYVKIFNDMN